MKKQELIDTLHSFDPVSYNNGFSNDIIHLGQIVAQFIEMDKGKHSTQSLYEVLAETLCMNGVISLQLNYKENNFNSYIEFSQANKDIRELNVFTQFDSILDDISKDLVSQIEKAELIFINDIKKEIKKIMDEETYMNIKLNKIVSFVVSSMKESFDLDKMNAIELSNYIHKNERPNDYYDLILKNTLIYFESHAI